MAVSVARDVPMFIDGAGAGTASGEWLEVRSPATGEVVGRVPAGTPADVDRAVAAARAAFNAGTWSRRLLAERAAILGRFADLIEANADDLARLETLQTGTAYKLRRDSDLPFAVDNLRFFAGAVRHLEGKAAFEYSGSHTSFVRREPIGVVGQVSPWNYPLWMAIWKIGPALAAGNSVVLKPASATPLTTIRLAELAFEAGVPAGVFNVVTGRGAVVGSALAAHGDVDLVSLTGDTETGRTIQAAAAGNLKRTHLELGGKAPFIVHADADIEAAARGATAGALINGGQDCTAATRVYVHRSIADGFTERLATLFAGVRVGDPLDPATDMGTLISAAQVDRVEGFVERAKAAGARVVVGGARPSIPGLPSGAFYLPTVLTGATQDSDVVQNEVFGPVLVVLPFDTEEESLRLANDTRYGLAASVWTNDLRVAMRATIALNFGHVLVNDHLMITSEMPHGGFRQSGFGKDMSMYSFEEYTRVKHVMIELTGERREGLALHDLRRSEGVAPSGRGRPLEPPADAGPTMGDQRDRDRRAVTPWRTTPAVPPITELTRIEPVHLERLAHQGIFTTGLLLEVSETPTRRQTLADQVDASTNDVLEWRDEALLLNLAGFGAAEHDLFRRAGYDGLASVLKVDIETFRAALGRAAMRAKVDPPTDLVIETWWDQARTLEDE